MFLAFRSVSSLHRVASGRTHLFTRRELWTNLAEPSLFSAVLTGQTQCGVPSAFRSTGFRAPCARSFFIAIHARTLSAARDGGLRDLKNRFGFLAKGILWPERMLEIISLYSCGSSARRKLSLFFHFLILRRRLAGRSVGSNSKCFCKRAYQSFKS